MGKKRKKGVQFKSGVAFKKTKKGDVQIDSLSDALEAESKCGCGIDCCKGVITLWDQDDPKQYYEISIKSGALVVTAK